MDGRLVIARSPVLEDSPAPFVVEFNEYSGPSISSSRSFATSRSTSTTSLSRACRAVPARIRTLGLDQAADYLEMAARLLRIKAQLLLPRMVRTTSGRIRGRSWSAALLEYQQIREIVDHMERLADDRRRRFSRAYLPAAARATPRSTRPLAR